MRSLKVRKGEEWYAGECDSLVNSGRVWRSLRKTVMFDGGSRRGVDDSARRPMGSVSYFGAFERPLSCASPCLRYLT